MNGQLPNQPPAHGNPALDKARAVMGEFHQMMDIMQQRGEQDGAAYHELQGLARDLRDGMRLAHQHEAGPGSRTCTTPRISRNEKRARPSSPRTRGSKSAPPLTLEAAYISMRI